MIFIETDNGLGNCYSSQNGKVRKGIVILEEDYINFIDNNVKENIIDLIKVDDYVNGELITLVQPQDICGDEVLDHQHIYTGEFAHNTEIYKYEIERIVTKEQFERMEYKVGE